MSVDAAWPNSGDVQHHGEIACLALKQPSVLVLLLRFDAGGAMTGPSCTVVHTPLVIRSDYPALAKEADRQRMRIVEIGKRPKKGRRR
jgi:hypothetical protein